MSLLSDVKGDGTKIPFLDPPKGAGAGVQPITYGTKVALCCQGIEITTQVMVVERFGTTFVGRVLGFTPCTKVPDGLAAGDFIRFQAKDVHRVA